MTTTYIINKGVGKSLQFKGIKGQYIWWLGGGMVAILMLFAILYIAGLSPYACLAIALGAGTALVVTASRLSHRFGEHGLMKLFARRKVPPCVRSRSRQLFLSLHQKSKQHGNAA